ncbi:hypothetical protein JHK86_052263 [Glycine max]|nr:hypothetical protein JHK86_052263 [Glycine max]
MIVTEASKITQDVSTSGKHAGPSTDEENIARMLGATEGSVVLRSPSKSLKGIQNILNLICRNDGLWEDNCGTDIVRGAFLFVL